MPPFTVWSEPCDRLDGTVDGTEPVRCPRREFHRLTGFDGEVAVAKDQPHLTGQHIHPVVPLVHG